LFVVVVACYLPAILAMIRLPSLVLFFILFHILREGAVNQFLEMRIDRFENGQIDRTDDDADVWEMMAAAGGGWNN
jgi:hypothetical protein